LGELEELKLEVDEGGNFFDGKLLIRVSVL
jgi:hypothetical protein